MNPLIGAGLVTGGMNLIGSAINSILGRNQSKHNYRLQYQYNKALQDDAFAHNVDMWNKQNEYNSPSAQMSRLKAAGLNPNLMYGQGSTGNASSAPRYEAPSVTPNVQPFQLPQITLIETIQKLMQNAESIRNARKSGDLLSARTTNTEVDSSLKSYNSIASFIKSKNLLFDLGVKSELRKTQVDLVKESLRKIRLQAEGQERLNKMRKLQYDIADYEQKQYEQTGATRSTDVFSRLFLRMLQSMGLNLGSSRIEKTWVNPADPSEQVKYY